MSFVADKLRAFGCDSVAEKVGVSGVVGVIKGRHQDSGKVIGLCADMDALPIQETTGLPYASQIAGRMHACGHDGHTAMLLGAAKSLAETRNFDGTAELILQPAEEGGAGAKAMCDDGLMTRWHIGKVFALHNEPGLPIGHFATRTVSLVVAMPLCLAASLANAQDIPRYNAAAYCQPVSEVSGGSSTIYNGCIEMEQEAYDDLRAIWPKLPSRMRSYCDGVAKVSGGTYSIFKGCVDMEADAAAETPEFKF